jgi:sialidase-1
MASTTPALLCCLLLSATLSAQEPSFHDVFTSGTEGYASIRIPSMVVTQKGSVVAFAEGRKVASDQAENDIVTKRSTDGGKTWSALKVIHDDGPHSLNNPTAVVLQSSGRILLMYQRIPGHLKEHSKNTATGYEGPDIYRNLLVWSDDDGQSWTAPQDITRSTKRPVRATTICSGPGVAIQLTRGAHKGRVIFPFNEGPFWQWQNFSVYSDDEGKSWQCGEDTPGALIPDAKMGTRSQVNEVQMVELSDGSVRLDSRQFAGQKVRKTAVSKDGGHSWSAVSDLADLPDSSCMAGILRYSYDDAAGKGRIIHTGPAVRRERGTVYLSVDDGASFPVKRELHAGGFAYSVPVRLPNDTLGCFFEADGYKRITLARIPMSWVEAGQQPAATKP